MKPTIRDLKLSANEIAIVERRARKIVAETDWPTLWAIAAELGFADSLGSAEYRKRTNDQYVLDMADKLIEQEAKRESTQRARKQLEDMLRDAPEGSVVKTILTQRLKKTKS